MVGGIKFLKKLVVLTCFATSLLLFPGDLAHACVVSKPEYETRELKKIPTHAYLGTIIDVEIDSYDEDKHGNIQVLYPGSSYPSSDAIRNNSVVVSTTIRIDKDVMNNVSSQIKHSYIYTTHTDLQNIDVPYEIGDQIAQIGYRGQRFGFTPFDAKRSNSCVNRLTNFSTLENVQAFAEAYPENVDTLIARNEQIKIENQIAKQTWEEEQKRAETEQKRAEGNSFLRENRIFHAFTAVSIFICSTLVFRKIKN